MPSLDDGSEVQPGTDEGNKDECDVIFVAAETIDLNHGSITERPPLSPGAAGMKTVPAV